ncbi:hypothetical protein [Tomitella cavernea]|uniref:Uncharacterized protein n=1 Tax=Tomitella cavernea TaxID=1387982 RepID=A0ABP9CEL2_9ACTN|nr:hypothetical protein [Tomitella cavernea]
MSPDHWPGDAGDLLAADPLGVVADRLWAAIVRTLGLLEDALGLPMGTVLGEVDASEWVREVLDGL